MYQNNRSTPLVDVEPRRRWDCPEDPTLESDLIATLERLAWVTGRIEESLTERR